METYTALLKIEVQAESKIDAFDIIKEVMSEFGVDFEIEAEVNDELFAELGVKYD